MNCMLSGRSRLQIMSLCRDFSDTAFQSSLNYSNCSRVLERSCAQPVLADVAVLYSSVNECSVPQD